MVSTAVMATTRADHAATNDQGGSCPSPQAAVTACDAEVTSRIVGKSGKEVDGDGHRVVLV